MLTNVLEAFRLVFSPTDITLASTVEDNLTSMPLDSSCGDDCAQVIDHALTLLQDIRQAYGHHRPDMVQSLASITASVCQCFITG
jgi:hypothetical protein